MVQIDIVEDKLIPLVSRKEGEVSVESITGKNPKTILKWTKGVLACVKIGGSWYTTKAALEAFSKRGTDAISRKAALSEAHLRSEAFLRARLHRGKT